MNKVIKNLVFSVFFLIILSIISIVVILWTYSNELPDYKYLKNYKPPVSSKLYSGEGELVIDFATEKRIFIPYNSIPKIVINSLARSLDDIKPCSNNLANLSITNFEFFMYFYNNLL